MGTWKKQRRIDLNPSSADRWTTCTASPKYIFDNWDKLPPENRTYADEGNTAHEVAAALLQGRKVNRKECPVPVTPEMNWNGWQYMEYVEGLLEPGGRIIVEQRLPLFYATGRNAVIDAGVINPTNLHIIDYKYGEGVIVSPENNLQATIYAKSVMWSAPRWNDGKQFLPPDDFPVTVHIFQPRSRNAVESPVHIWETTVGEIYQRSEHIMGVAHQILSEQEIPVTLQFAPSPKACQFCPAKGFCEARPAELTRELQMLATIDDSPKPPARVLTETQLAAIVRHGDQIKKWIDDAQEFALQHMKAGGRIPGFKLVMSRGGNRFWADPKKAAKYLLTDSILTERELFTEPKLVGPAQVEKLLGKGKIPGRAFGLISKPPGQPVIAPEDDSRESALVDGVSEFQDLDAPKSNLDQF